jgi:osmotically inducible lipoprotein OsmB
MGRMRRVPVRPAVLEASMKHLVFAALVALAAGACTTTEERVGGAAVGAGVGAVAGPVGAVAGGAVGAATGPTVSRSVRRATR